MNTKVGCGAKRRGIAAFSPISTAAIVAYAVLITVLALVLSNTAENSTGVLGSASRGEIANQVDDFLPAVMAAPAEPASAADAAAVSERLQQIDQSNLQASVKAAEARHRSGYVDPAPDAEFLGI